MKFFKNKILNKDYLISNKHFKISKWSFSFFALLICCHTILNAQLLTNPTRHAIQTGDEKNSFNDPFLNEIGGPCGIEQSIGEMSLNDPNFAESSVRGLQQLIAETDSIVNRGNRFARNVENVIIPVVFHYFYDECAPGHPSYETGPPQIYTNERFENAVRILNEDFSGVTSANDPDVGAFNIPQRGSRISFRLAEVDPEGNPTNGINMVRNGLTYAGVGDQPDLREVIQWPRNTYFNIYVVERVNSSFSSGIARFPEQSDDRFIYDESYDGVAISRWALDPTYSGPGSVGKPIRNDYRTTLSHETGHWLGLRHVWGNENKISGNNYCSIDDFDFYNDLMNSPHLADENGQMEFTFSLTELDDTPPTNKPPDATWRTCSHVDSGYDGCGNNDHDFNIMDYSGCRVLFTNGQKTYMEAVMSTSLSQRNEIKGNNVNAFHTGYSNYNDPITTPAVVFNKGSIFYEDESNDGTIYNELTIELRGGAAGNPFKFRPNWTNVNTLLHDGYYNFLNTSGQIINLNAEILITSDQTATLKIIDTENNLTNIDKVKISFDSQIFSQTVDEKMRSKELEFDFIKSNMVYNTSGGNSTVGPSSYLYREFNVDGPLGFKKPVFLCSYDGKYGLSTDDDASIEFGIDVNGLVKTFAKDQTITNNISFGSDLDLTNPLYSDGPVRKFREIAVNLNTDEFYVAVKMNRCNEGILGWLRLRVDENCEGLIILDSGVNSSTGNIKAGEIDNPTLITNPTILNRLQSVDSYTIESIKLELMPGETSLKISSQIANNFDISVIYPPNLIISESDLTISKLDDYTAEVKPANTPFWETHGDGDIRLELNFNSNAFIGSSANLVKRTKIYINDVNFASNDQDEKSSMEAIFSTSQFTNFFGSGKGFARYNDGYSLWSGNGRKTEVACIPGTNEIQLFNSGELISDNAEFKFARGGHTNLVDDLFDPDGVIITDATIQSLVGQSRYVVYRNVINCETYYNWIKIDFNANSSFVVSEYGSSFVNDLAILTGFIPSDYAPAGENECLAEVTDANDYMHIRKLIFDVGFPGQVEFNDNVGFEIDRYSDFTAEPLFTLNLQNKVWYQFELKFGGQFGDDEIDSYGGTPGNPDGYNITYSAVWIDFNQNGIYEQEEQIFNDQNRPQYNNQVYFSHTFSNYMSGDYKMRIATSLFEIPIGPGCLSIVYGEIEDYSFDAIGQCAPSINYQNELSINEGTVFAESIDISANSNLGYKTNILPNSNNSLYGESVCISPSTVIHYGSVFLAEAINCDDLSTKQTQVELPTSTVKVYPNPFSQQSTVEFELHNDSEVSIFVSDITGKKLATLANSEQKTAGIHKVTFDAKGIAPGIYYCTLINGDKIETQKMVITK